MADEDTTYTQAELDAKIDEAVKGLKANQNKALDQFKGLQRALDELGGLDSIKTRLTEFANLESEMERLEAESKATDAGLTTEKLKEIEASTEKRLEKKYAPLQDQLAEAQKQVRTLTLDNVVKAMMPKHGVRSDRVDALYRVARDHFDLTDDFSPILKSDPGGDIGEFIEGKLANDWPEFYEGTGSSGGGASKASAGGAGGYRRTVPAGDNAAFLNNLDAIAAGKVQVR